MTESHTLQQALETARRRIKELEEELAKQESSNNTPLEEVAFESAPGGMAILSSEGIFLACNKVGADILGYTVSEMDGLPIDRLCIDEKCKTLLKTSTHVPQSINDNRISMRRKDGERIWVDMDITPVEYGSKQAVLLSFIDITPLKELQSELNSVYSDVEQLIKERTADLENANYNLGALNHKLIKRDVEHQTARKSLQESEQQFRSIFENNHAVMLIIDPDSGAILDANPAAVEFYGYSLREIKTLNIAHINTLDDEEILQEVKNAEQEKRNHFFFKHRLANGDIRDVEVFSGPITSISGRILYSIVHDITERREAEEKLEQYRRIIATATDLYSLVDRDYRCTMVNDSYLSTFKLKKSDVIGKPLQQLMGQPIFDQHIKPYLERAFKGEACNTEHRVQLSGEDRFFTVTYNPVPRADGTIDYVSIVSRDITELKEQEQNLRIFSERLAIATNAGEIGIWELNTETNEVFWDDMMRRLYGLKASDDTPTYEEWRSFVHEDDLPKAERALQGALKNNSQFSCDFRITRPDGEERHIKTAAQLTAANGNPRAMTGVNWDITKTRKLQEELQRLATTDSLTCAHNRRSFMERAHSEVARSHRHGIPLALLTLDIDHFKRVNDTYGHPAGDEVLKSLVNVCQETLRFTDVFARMGGEEFAAILPETQIPEAIVTAERVRKAVASTPVNTDAGIIDYTVSIGISTLRDDDDSLDDLMRRADKALYKAKENGRNRVETE
ncbi:MAG: hypothetical protein CL942_09095 [Desulfovibrio sp.]|nr:hypothetical protein [Desulfovibrio sp.]|tara:strand:- start:17231 stop:19435 length:2205 start_codon:yes stop_codon:yes gene_type:complete